MRPPRRFAWLNIARWVIAIGVCCSFFTLAAVHAQANQSYTITIPNDGSFALIANQLDHGSNRLDEVITNVPDGTTLLKWDCSIQDWDSIIYTFAVGSGWSPNGMLAPGEGALIGGGFGTGTNFAITFTGTPHVPVLPATLPCGYDVPTMLSRQTNGPGTFENITGLSPTEGAQVRRWNVAAQDFIDICTFTNGDWSPNAPALAAGESALVLVPSPPAAQSYTVAIEPGLNLIANQLDHGSNRLAEVFSSLCCLDHGSNEGLVAIPAGTIFSKARNDGSNTWDQAIYMPGTGWVPDNLTLSPGEGAFLQSSSAFNITFTGTPHVPVLPMTLPSGRASLLSRQTNGPGTWENIVGASPPNGAQVWRWNAVAQSFFDTETYTNSVWSPETPTADVGEAVWIAPTGGTPQLPPSFQAYTVAIEPGLNLIANQLDHGSNRLAELLIANQLDHGSNNLDVAIPAGTIFSKARNDGSNTWDQAIYMPGTGWVPDDLTLSPGEGAYLFSPTNFTIIFTGTPHVPVLPVTLPGGRASLLSRQTNDVGTYESIVGSAPPAGAKMYKWNPGSQSFVTYTKSPSGTNWTPSIPTVAVGESVWIARAGGTPQAPPTLQAYSVPIYVGFNFIANQLDHGSNRISEVLGTNCPSGSAVWWWDHGSNNVWLRSVYLAGSGWSSDTTQLNPGDGVVLESPSNFTLTFTGQPHVPVLPAALTAGEANFRSRQTNGPGTWENIVGTSPADGATVYQWTGANYATNVFAGGSWTPTAPALAVGESAWFSLSTSSPPPPVELSYTINLPGGGNGNYYLIANQLDHGSNTLDDVLPNMPDGTILLKWDCSLQDFDSMVSVFSAGTGHWSPNDTLVPGEGALISPPGPLASITFTGSPHVPVLPVTLPCGYGEATMLSRQTNGPGTFENITGLAPTEGAQVRRWNVAAQDFFDIYTYTNSAWSPSAPTLAVGEAALVSVPTPIQNANRIWVGLGTNNNWTTSSNWDVAIAAGDSLFFDGNTRLTPSNDFPAGTVFSNITFNNGAGPFVLAGNPITLAGNITNQASGPETISCDIVLSSMNAVFQIGGNGTTLTNRGPISGSGGLTKMGAGSLVLAAPNTYTGGTVVKAGTLALSGNGSIASSAFFDTEVDAILDARGRADRTLTVASGQALKGNGTVLGNLTIASGGTLAPSSGTSPIGFINIESNADFAGTVQMEINRTNTPNCDLIVIVSNGPPAITYGGTLTVSNLGPPLQAGDTFTLFSAPHYNGFFDTEILPSLAAGLAWDTSGLASSGTIRVAQNQTNTLNIPMGQSLIANQLDHGSNTADIIFPNPTGLLDGDSIAKWNCTGSVVAFFDSASPSGFSDLGSNPIPPPTLNPGEAFFFDNQNGALSVTFTGAPHVPVLPATLPCGFGQTNYLSRQTNDIGTYQNITGLNPADGAKEQIWIGSSFAVYTFTNGAWLPTNPPNLAVGQGAVFIVPASNNPPTLSYTISIHAGMNLIANQLDHGSNTLDEVLPGLPSGCILSKFNNASGMWSQSRTFFEIAWGPDNVTLNPGEGAFLFSPTNFNITFTGHPHVPVLPVTIPAGQSWLLSRQTNDVGTYDNILGTAPVPSAKALSYSNAYTVYIFDDIDLIWQPTDPVAPVGTALWLSPSGAAPPHPYPPPYIACSTDKTVACGSAWSFDPPLAIGQSPCGTNVNITVVSTTTNGVCPGTVTRTWRATDPCDVTSFTECSETVHIMPVQNPPLSITISSNSITLDWNSSGPCHAQSTSALQGNATVWTDLAGLPPLRLPISATSQFFRLACP